MTEVTDILSEIGWQIISPDKPSGVNIRYDDEFEFVEDELAKQDSMIDRGRVRWDKVTQTSINILDSKSKDLKVSCYLTRALYEEKGFQGLQIGLSINYQLLTTFWDDLYPIKQRARTNAYEWLSAKFEFLFDNLEPDLESLNCLEASYESIQKIELFLKEKLSENAPALGNFRRSIHQLLEPLQKLKENEDEIKLKIKEKQKAEADFGYEKSDINETSDQIDLLDINAENLSSNTNKSPSYSGQSAVNKTTINPSNIAEEISEKDKNKIIRQCHETLGNLSSLSINKDLDSPSAYAMNRFSTWMGISQLPIHDNFITPLRPLPKDKINTYANLFANKKFQELIPQVELSFSKAPFWLDAHRIVSLSLEAMGMDDAATQVKEYLAIFLRRFPDLLNLKFSDNSDFADQLTRQWINSEVLANGSTQVCVTTESDDDSDLTEITAKARDLVKQKKIKEAIQVFQNNINRQSNFRRKTFWKYYLAQFCYDNGEYQISYNILTETNRLLQKNNLQSWEPDLEKNTVYLLIRCLQKVLQAGLQTGLKSSDKIPSDEINKMDINTDYKHKSDFRTEYKQLNKLYNRLCQLDPMLAIDVQ